MPTNPPVPYGTPILDIQGMDFRFERSYPSYQHWLIEDLAFTDNDHDCYDNFLFQSGIHLRESYNQEILHKLFGYSDALQGDTNYHWAQNHLAKNDLRDSPHDLQKNFELLFQISFEDGLFGEFWDGVAYFGYRNDAPLSTNTIECVFQNT